MKQGWALVEASKRTLPTPLKGKAIDIRQVGRDLGVKYVLESSIQTVGERIRVTAQLIEVNTRTHVWSERFDRPVGDLFLVQNEVTERITAAISGYEGAVADAERALLHCKAPLSVLIKIGGIHGEEAMVDCASFRDGVPRGGSAHRVVSRESKRPISSLVLHRRPASLCASRKPS